VPPPRTAFLPLPACTGSTPIGVPLPASVGSFVRWPLHIQLKTTPPPPPRSLSLGHVLRFDRTQDSVKNCPRAMAGVVAAAANRCMNPACGAPVGEGGDGRKGWPLRSGDLATLCDKCGYGLSSLRSACPTLLLLGVECPPSRMMNLLCPVPKKMLFFLRSLESAAICESRKERGSIYGEPVPA
jgi:hypothetical protein